MKNPTHVLFYLIVPLIMLAGDKQLTIHDIYTARLFRGESLNHPQWLPDGSGFVYRKFDSETRSWSFVKYDVPVKKHSLFLNTGEIASPALNGSRNFIWSNDFSKLMFTRTVRARRTKSAGDIFLVDVENKLPKTLRQLTKDGEGQLIIQFSPDGRQIGFVRNNNLLVIDLQSGKERQLTFDGTDHILNGHFDWVYEEEFSIIDGWQWSPDGKHIAYWQLDESRVPEFPITHYDSLHLNLNVMRYPKAGDPNSLVRIGVVDVQTGKTLWMDIGSETDIYIPRIHWLNNRQLLILRLNRLQNQLDYLSADISNGSTHLIYQEKDDRWIDIPEDLTVIKNGFVFSSDRSGYRHVYRFDLKSEKPVQLTRGNWEVRKIEQVNEKQNLVFFTAANPTPMEAQLFSVNLDGGDMKRISRSTGWHQVNIAPDGGHYIDAFSSLTEPTKTALFDREGNLLDTLVSNPMEVLAEYKLSAPRFFSFTTGDGQNLNGWMLPPVDFDESQKYPVFMYVYSGPGSQTVRNRWGTVSMWHQLLAQKGYLVISVDNRGTGFRGADFMKKVYKQLGYWETNDQIEAARYLSTLPFVDSTRIGVFGWSYGGYMAALCILKGSDVFKTAVAVAPVTDWRFYDTIYTERYMQTPQLNPEGYQNSAPLNFTERLEGKFLLIHGTADDNVHFQNTAMLVNKLIEANKQFDIMFYPDRYHGIYGKSRYTREHVFTTITKFVLENL